MKEKQPQFNEESKEISGLKQIESFEQIKGVRFKKSVSTIGKETYKSSESGRKLIEVSPHEAGGTGIIIDEDVPYDVEVLRDTNPSDRTKGKLLVRIVGKTEEGHTDERTEEQKNREVEEAPMKESKKEKEPRLIPPIEVDYENKKVYVLETELSLNNRESGDVPAEKDFRHFTLDRRTVETLEKVATAVELHEPCLLEGETSTSKTSSIFYLAMKTKNEVRRLNFNGQTDTSELIGKFVPNDGQLQISFEEMLKNKDILSLESKVAIDRAAKENRGLTLIESQKIAKAEGLVVSEWRWQDGIVPEAMKKGKWVILDELTLAEPQIRERLNSVLEKDPSLTLSENGGLKIGSGGNFEVHPDFRIFATTNPAEYAGRFPMSPAEKDRWTSYKFVRNPSQAEYRAMMDLMVYGDQPPLEIGGTKYAGAHAESLFTTLEKVPNFNGFLEKLAKFQVVMEDLARRREIGKNKKEKYIFTRRGLIEFLEYLEKKSVFDRSTKTRKTVLNAPNEIVGRAIQYYFLDKISDSDDLKKVVDHVAATGILMHKFEEVKKPTGVEAKKGKEEKMRGEGKSLESFEKLKLQEQYDAQIELLKNAGILEQLITAAGRSKDFGIKSIENLDLIPPTFEEISKRFIERKDVLEKKIEQGFTKLLLVPMGMSLDTLIEKYKQALLRHHADEKLFATKEKPSDRDELLDLDIDNPVYVWEKYKNADKNNELVYYPNEFKKSGRGCKTKTELMGGLKFPGWEVVLVEDLPNIPRETKGGTMGGRKQLEANKTPTEYLDLLRKNPVYAAESGLTPEAWLIYAITHLEETNQVVDDFQGKGSICYNVGAYFPSSSVVPDGCWHRDGRRADLHRSDPSSINPDLGCRSGVRI